MLTGRLYYQPSQSGFNGFVGFTEVLDGFYEQNHIHASTLDSEQIALTDANGQILKSSPKSHGRALRIRIKCFTASRLPSTAKACGFNRRREPLMLVYAS
jgi:hypothetical protein